MTATERRKEASDRAIAAANQRADENAYWFAAALVARNTEAAARIADRRARAEVVEYFGNAQNLGDMVLARSKFDLAPMAADEPVSSTFCWAPRGTSDLSLAGCSGQWCGALTVDQAAFAAISASFLEFVRAGHQPYIDFGHKQGERAATVRAFFWEPDVGILAHVQWTPLGEQLIRDRVFASFSPRMQVDSETGRVLGLADGFSAGGLVNAPAFATMPPITVNGRTAAADLMQETLMRAGLSADTSRLVAAAVAAGHDSAAIDMLLQTIG